MKIKNKNFFKNKDCRPKDGYEGFIALVALLIILGIIILIGLTVSQLSIGEAQMAFQRSQSLQAYYLASLCGERALITLKENSSYAGENINIEGGSCEIYVEGNWILRVKADFQNQVKKIRVIISQINPQITIQSWQEVADF